MVYYKIFIFLFVSSTCTALPYGDDNNDIYSNDDYEDVASTSNEMTEGNEQVIHRLPTFTSVGETMLVNEGSTIRLPCIVNRLDGFVLLWKKGDEFVAVGEQMVVKNDPRIQLIRETNENGGMIGNTLVISLAEESDAGDYVCQVSTFKPVEIKHSVKIRVKPVVQRVPDNGIIVAETGDTVKLECQVTRGYPTPEITWRRKERKMPTGEDAMRGLSLTYKSVTRHHSGIYICSADNGFGQPTETEMKLDVQHKPEIEQEETFIHTGEGDQTEVICIVHSSPRPKLTWYKDGTPLDGSNYLMNQRGNRHTLTIPGVDASKFGKYTCRASNSYGEDQKTTEVSGKAEQAQINSDPKGVEYDRYNLEWSARSVSPISNFKVEWKTLGDEKWKETEVEAYPMPNSDNSYAGTHMITKLNPATVYLVKVSSKNVYGYSNPSQAFKFATRGADPVQKPITGNGAVPNHPLSVIFTTTLCSSLIYLLQLH